ncbi:glycosyltransferase family 39 protein [Cryomorpha ignava]|uniref:Glycosyltransferase family 39 protein n=1 Tax=Cryomorpha ignava TaxID=101383 RepID=A0A7K3WUS9_9FLAO|nr:glycosyltransferase family 39 protein [Cryomorpha ignava]NEN25264.1 glycosyltransferase family 39 protein [Cryomorpha ignava]
MTSNFKLNRSTLVALLVIGAFLIFETSRVIGDGGAITWDAFGFYYYLKLIFVDHSLILESLDSIKPIFEKYDPSTTLYQFTTLPNGRIIVRYPIGQALLYLPFFIIAHITALLSDFPADGFSKPYDIAMRIGGLIYHFLGFYFVGRILRLHFSDKVVGITLVVLFFGTNAFSLFMGSALSAQGSLFFLVAWFIWLVDRYFKEKTNGLIIGVGCVFGLICLNRPTDFVTLIPAILWPLTIPGLFLKEEIKSFFKRKKQVFLLIGTIVFFAFIQFGYWKYAGGSWFIDSYGNPAEGLDFLSPHTIPFLFSFKSGWLVYTPLMILVLIFLIYKSYKKDRTMQVVLIYTVLFIYLASSWTNWWYGNGFSQRAMGQAYALLSIPLAGLINFAFFKKHKFSFLPAILIPVFVVLSIWQTKQFHNGVLTGETVTADYYFASFFDLYQNPENKDLLGFSHYDIYMQPNYNLPDGYELANTVELAVDEENQNLAGNEWPKGFSIPYKDLSDADYSFILFSAVFEGSPPKSAVLVTTFNHNGAYGYQGRDFPQVLVDTNFVANLYTATSVYLTPPMRSTNDKFSAYLWNRGLEAGILKELRLEVFVKSEDN